MERIFFAHNGWNKSFSGCLIVGHSVLDALMVCQAARVVIGHCATFIAALQVAGLYVDIVHVTAQLGLVDEPRKGMKMVYCFAKKKKKISR